MKSLLTLLLTIALTVITASAAERPNLIFINADDLTHHDLGAYGGQAHTPNISRLVEEGMKFERCFQAAPMCSPTRHNIYTGLYPVKSGAYPNHTFAKAGTKSIVHYLEPLGYRVALSGKSHIAPQEVFPFEYTVEDKNPDMKAIEELMVDRAENGTPFCLFACSNEPHTPWDRGDASRYPVDEIELPPYLVDTSETRDGFSRYLAEITYYDDQVGQILTLLEKHGLEENTLVMVSSEQGNSMPFAKWTLYDNGLQTALVARWLGKIEPGSTTNAMVEYVDVLPTLVAAAGGEADANWDGESFLPVLKGEADEHKDYVYGIMTTKGVINHPGHYGIRSVRSDQYKLIVNLTPEVTFTNACTKSPEFLSWVAAAEGGNAAAAERVRRYQKRPGIEFFDVTKDPDEWNNLAENPEYAEQIQHLQEKLNAWMESQGDEGQATELAAYEHQKSGRKKKQNTGKKKP